MMYPQDMTDAAYKLHLCAPANDVADDLRRYAEAAAANPVYAAMIALDDAILAAETQEISDRFRASLEAIAGVIADERNAILDAAKGVL